MDLKVLWHWLYSIQKEVTKMIRSQQKMDKSYKQVTKKGQSANKHKKPFILCSKWKQDAIFTY